MLFNNLFSERNSPPCPKLVFDRLDEGCRLQIKYLVQDFFEDNHIRPFCDAHIWPGIQEGLKRLHKTKSLHQQALYETFGGHISPFGEVLGYLETEKDFHKTMDTIEVVFRMIADIENLMNGSGYPFSVTPDQAIDGLNSIFSKNCIGYKFVGNMLIRIDNELLYNNITKEVMIFLSNPDYFNINEEYLQAHRHYRKGDYEDCIVNCNKAFESTMKVICQKRKYPYNQKDTASVLVDILVKNNFIPPMLQNQFTGIRKTLEAGVPVIRNKQGGHGKGAATIVVDENTASYALNLAGSAIKYLLGYM
jgi:AbiJ N-terminal domain 4